MIRMVPALLFASLLAAALPFAQAQEPPPPAPVPVALPSPQPASPAPPPPPTMPQGYPGTIGQQIHQMRQDHLPPAPPPEPGGWFAGLEADLVKPHVNNRLRGRVRVEDLASTLVAVPTTELDWTVAPRFELGYRLPGGQGEFLFSYRFLVSEGTDQGIAADDELRAQMKIRSRLDLNVFDLDYAIQAAAPCSGWDVRWKVGARVANVFFDSKRVLRLTDLDSDSDFRMVDRVSNHFIGGGPHLGLDVWRQLGASGIAVFGRVEGAIVIGQVSQSFEERFSFSDLIRIGGASRVSETQAVPVLNFQAGLGWVPPAFPCTRFSIGYQYEHWWNLGDVGSSQANLWDQGVFFRGEYRF